MGDGATPAAAGATPGGGRRLATSLVLAVLVGCGPKAPPGTTKTSLEPPVHDATVAVREFPIAADAITSYDGPRDAFGLILAEEIVRELRDRGHDAHVVRADAPTSAPLVVVGRITMLDGGSRGLRYWVGFSAGAAKLGVAGEVVRDNGERVGTFTDERWSAFGKFGGASQDLLEKCARTLGEDIAEMVDTGEYRQVGRPVAR